MSLSGNDLYTVSGSDIDLLNSVTPEVDVQEDTSIFVHDDLVVLAEKIDFGNNLLISILFFMIFKWIEVRLRNSIRRMFKQHE